jgi:hypothetical protein
MSAAFIGLDLAKSVFQVHGVDCASAWKSRPVYGVIGFCCKVCSGWLIG